MCLLIKNDTDSGILSEQVFQGMFVNLVDLVDTGNTGRIVTQFSSLPELVEYTKTTGKYFPKESAYAGGVLKLLLREILTTHIHRSLGRKRR